MTMHSGDGATVIITASSEGNLAHRTVRSVLRAASLARQQFPVEILAILDAPTAETQAYFARHAADFSQILRVAFEDVSLARNYAVQRAHGRYVTFVTAADLVSSNWLLASVAKAQELDDDRAVFHCEYNFDFSAQARVTAHIDERSPAFSLAQLFDADCWPGICLAERGLVLDIPFASANRDEGWGHADWHWNCEVIAAGGAHHVVPGTAHFVRADSAISAGLGTNAERPAHAPLMRSTRLLDQWEEATRRHTAIQPALAPPRPARQARLDRLAASLRTRIRAHVSDKPRLRAAARRVVTAVQAMQSARKAIAASELLADPLPDWLIDQWRAMHEIEPTLLPTADRGANIPRGHATSGAAAEVYLQAAARWRADRTHVFLLPWMKRGGSDLVVLHQMRALAELGCDRQLCLTTEACDSPWLSELPAGTDVLEFGKLAAHLSDDARLAVLAHLLVQRGPSHVHCINSALGLRLFARHGRALGIQSRLFASMWCPDYSLDGYSGYANEFLFDIFPHLTTVFCDNRRFVDELVEKYDFDRERFQVLDFPTRVTAKPRCAGGAGRLEVLWASRLDRQKRPDVLLEIVEACRSLPIHFHVFGAPALEANRYPAKLRACANVTYHGEYDGFGALPTERFDVLLYTTAWDGLPNVLLEGMGAGLVCVAPDVGGIAELITRENGCLVSRSDAVEEYAHTLALLAADRERVAELRRRGPEYIARHRNWSRFVEQVRGNRRYAVPTSVAARAAA